MNTTRVVNAYRESNLETLLDSSLNRCNNKRFIYISKLEDPNPKINKILDFEVTGKEQVARRTGMMMVVYLEVKME